MTEKSQPTPQDILQMKEQIWKCWEQLPPEHQATITLVMVQTVMNGEYELWLWDAWKLFFGEEVEHDRGG
jgi:hypothetical protein